jgi:hypothetical protein
MRMSSPNRDLADSAHEFTEYLRTKMRTDVILQAAYGGAQGHDDEVVVLRRIVIALVDAHDHIVAGMARR